MSGPAGSYDYIPPEKPDWSQTDPTQAQVKDWMHQHAGEFDSPRLLANAANEHFKRPFHINLMTDWARKAFDERQDPA